ncbi:MAG: tRNA pseudouridine(13) synthase TruD [bacterium]|nr:tRNA pseudouridine(13) synthase TruD [bacterium]
MTRSKQCNYKLKCINDDFQVTEVPLMPTLTLKRPRRFTYIWIQKTGFTTFDIIEQIKDFFKLSFSDVSSQGLKDEDAITEQLISIKKIIKNDDIIAFNKKSKSKKNFCHIKHIVGYGNEAVKKRMLHGNSFRIVIRNLDKTISNTFLSYISSQRHYYFINYYDNQRFGMPSGPYNTHLIGRAIVENKWKDAYKHLKNSNNSLPKITTKLESTSDFKEIFRLLNPRKVSFFVSAYNSFLWNSHASSVVRKYTKSKKHIFENVGYLYIPTASSFLCPNICEVDGYEFLAKNFTIALKKNSRNLVVATTIYADDLEKDGLHKGRWKLTLSFFLPTGSYATMIVKQIFLRLSK